VIGSAYPPMGQRFRLKAGFNISGYSPAMQVILTALKQYGMILADNGAPWFISGISDTRWNDDDLNTLKQITGSSLEAVDESSLTIDPNSGQATQSSSPTATSASVPTNTWVHIVSKNSGKCLDVAGGPAAVQPLVFVQQFDCWGGSNQTFELSPASGTAGYKITAQNSGLQLDVAEASSADGAPILQYPFWGGTNEIWNVQPTGDGYFTISPESSGKCMDVSGISILNGAPVWQWTCWGGNNQKWSFTPAN
jgi:hypothetical protein